MSEIILDTITGKSTATTITIGSTPVVSASANSMTIRGEGSNQTSIQQGLAKVWHHANEDATPVLEDSFNVASLTDTADGRQGINLTSNMANVNYAAQAANHASQSRLWFTGSLTTSSYISEAYAVANNAYQAAHQNSTAHGDLA